MEILIISKARGTAARFRLTLSTTLLVTAVLAAIVGATGYWGYARGGEDMAEFILNDPERSTEVWQRELILQRQFLNGMAQDLDGDLSALASTMGRLQGHLTRLDAVAERVVLAAQLDPVEFDLANPPAIGGPMSANSNPPRWNDLVENLGALGGEIAMRNARLTAIESLLLDEQLLEDMDPAGRPLQEGWISSGFGYRTDPVTGRREFHGGVDFAGKAGLEIKAVAAGVVTWSGKRWGYGNMVEITHGNGLITRYAHNRANLVALGDRIEKNQPVAVLGSTGRSTGPHVHFEVARNGVTVNPWNFIQRNSTP